jgi:hypothetical protein
MEKIALLTLGFTVACAVSADDGWRHISQSVTTQISQNGKLDKSRYVIFTFDYSNGMRDKRIPGYCWVKTITINNANCSSEGMFGAEKSIWINSEFSSKDMNGDDFVCRYADINDSLGELTIEEPKDFGDKIIHKLIVSLKGDAKKRVQGVSDYSGSLVKFSTITNKVESVSYIPIKKKDFGGWMSEGLGCGRIAIPVIRNR